ncbi:MAG TPA: T9SS type A sorting domain-containing protein, partial [Phaeodactylibacter sp.]|nr:T9SS type A sorting domain-containing protein [Phaeodactylibacter sp.]
HNNTDAELSVFPFPPNNNLSCYSLTSFSIDPNGLWTINVLEDLFTSCAGEWCFSMTKDMGTAGECTIDFCVTVGICEEVRLKEGWDLTYIRCPEKVAPFPPDYVPYGLVTTIDENESLVSKRKEISKPFLKEEKTKDIELKKIYPNPFTNELSINLDAAKESKINIRLADLLGKVVFERNENVREGDNLLQLNLENTLPSGSYILTISNIEGIRFSKKLIHL